MFYIYLSRVSGLFSGGRKGENSERERDQKAIVHLLFPLRLFNFSRDNPILRRAP